MFEVVKVNGEVQFKSFLRVPRQIYRKDPFWTPLPEASQRQVFNPQANPVLRYVHCELFVAMDNQKPVGRIAAITDTRLQDQQLGLFGCFESFEDINVARALLEAAGEHLAGRGKSQMQGPVTITTNQQVGLLVQGFDSPPQSMMPYNPSYYGPFLENLGFSKQLDLYSYLWRHEQKMENTKLALIAARAAKIKGIRVRPINLNDPWGEGARLADIHNRAMTNQWGFVPLDQEEGAYYLAGIRSFADPELVTFCEVDNKVVGVCLITPDLGPQIRAARSFRGPAWLLGMNKPKSVRVGILAVAPEYRRRGVVALLIDRALRIATRKGYRQAELSLIMDGNYQMNSIITSSIGSNIDHVYRIYQREIPAGK